MVRVAPPVNAAGWEIRSDSCDYWPVFGKLATRHPPFRFFGACVLTAPALSTYKRGLDGGDAPPTGPVFVLAPVLFLDIVDWKGCAGGGAGLCAGVFVLSWLVGFPLRGTGWLGDAFALVPRLGCL